MARVARKHLVAENSTNHCTWRSHGFRHLLKTDEEKGQFLALLARFKDQFGIVIHQYCIMDSHPHVQTTATLGQKAFSEFWKRVNWSYARWYNKHHGGRGQVVMDRMTSPRIQADASGIHQLRVMRYGDLNPVRAGIARSAKDWRWSSYRHYAFGETDPLVVDAPAYLALGRTNVERRRAYVHLFATALSDGLHQRRPDLTSAAFIGEHSWVGAQSVALRPAPA